LLSAGKTDLPHFYIKQKHHTDSHGGEQILIEYDILVFYLLLFLCLDDIFEIAEEFIKITFLQYSIELSSSLLGHFLQERDIDTGLYRTSPFIVADEIIRCSDS